VISRHNSNLLCRPRCMHFSILWRISLKFKGLWGPDFLRYIVNLSHLFSILEEGSCQNRYGWPLNSSYIYFLKSNIFIHSILSSNPYTILNHVCSIVFGYDLLDHRGKGSSPSTSSYASNCLP
jgi:hypothetical protein